MAGRGASIGGAERRKGEHEVLVFGVLNVTPDSFSDGGRYVDADVALAHGLRLVSDGAHVIDVGGESTRPRGHAYGPGYEDVSADVECARVVPVVRALVAANVRVSIDTTKPEVAEAALEAGAAIVNDTSCGGSDRLLDAVSANGAELVLMHNRGRGEVDAANTDYGDVVRDVCDTLVRASAHATSRGVDPSRIWLDPGLGFAKTAAQSLCVHASLDRVVALGHPVLLGSSRKSFLAALAAEGSAPGPLPEARLGATIASALFGARTGVRGVRVHDVFEVAQALRVAHALDAARPREGSASWR